MRRDSRRRSRLPSRSLERFRELASRAHARDVAIVRLGALHRLLLLIIVRIILSWVQQFRPLPYNMALRTVIGFIEESVDPYLNLFRRFIPPLRVGARGST